MPLWAILGILFVVTPIGGCLLLFLRAWIVGAVLILIFALLTGWYIPRKDHVEIVSVVGGNGPDRYSTARVTVKNPSDVDYWRVQVICKDSDGVNDTDYTDLSGIPPYSVKQIVFRVDGQAYDHDCKASADSNDTGDHSGQINDGWNGNSQVLASEVIGHLPTNVSQ
jgi:hypothetical protein